MIILTLLLKNADPKKLVVDFLWERDTFRKDFVEKKLQQHRQTLEFVKDFACEDKTSDNLGDFAFVCCIFLHFFIFQIFFLFLHWECVHAHLFSYSTRMHWQSGQKIPNGGRAAFTNTMCSAALSLTGSKHEAAHKLPKLE